MDNRLRSNKAEPLSPFNSPEKVNEHEQRKSTIKYHGTSFIGPSFLLITSRKKKCPFLREADTGFHP